MFARVKKSGQYHYLQIVENNKVQGQVKQRVIATVGRLDHLQGRGCNGAGEMRRMSLIENFSWHMFP
jgi:hypothetical protein